MIQKSKKILCIGDSLALPGHLNLYEDTWFYKLKERFSDYDFISFFKRQLTTKALVTMGGGKEGVDRWPKGADCLEAFMPDIVILQLGIVDCAPRLLKKIDRVILKFFRGKTKQILISFFKKLRRRRLTNTLVSYDSFKTNMLNYVKRGAYINSKLIIVAISEPNEEMTNKNENIIKNVKKYNNLFSQLEEQFEFVYTTNSLKPEDTELSVYEDGYHPNKVGHDIIAKRIADILCRI